MHRASVHVPDPHSARRDARPAPLFGAAPLRAALALVLALAFASSWAVAAAPLVRVLIADAVPSVRVAFDGPHRGYLDGVPAFATPFALEWPVSARGGSLWVAGRDIGDTLLLRPDGARQTLAIDGVRYRGAVRLLAHGDGIRAVNLLDIESYLRGVVPAEMQAVWPLEALRAQAVAARTYTLTLLDPAADYDICATQDCQVYRGVAVEHPRADQAIADTRGVVLTYGGDFARTYYHADSGGAVASSAEVWGRSLPYLVAMSDVDSSSPHRSWTVDLDPTTAGRDLAARGTPVGELVSLRPLAYSASGRVVQLEVVGSAGRAVLAGTRLRTQLRGWGLKSTRFRVVGDLRVRGDGWGHGVGMSQYGARTLASSGYGYGQILGFYYPSTRLQQLGY